MSSLSQAKLRYDPVELDPEDMCRMASEEPQVSKNFLFSFIVFRLFWILLSSGDCMSNKPQLNLIC